VTGDEAALMIAMVVDAAPPGRTEPKSNELGLSVIPGAPDPLSATVRVPFELVIVNVAVLAPLLDGWKVSVAVVDAPAARLIVAGDETEKAEASTPVIANGGVSVTVTSDGLELLLVMVTVAVVLAPAATLPKLMLAGAVLMVGVGALLRFCGSLGDKIAKSATLLFESIWLPSRPPNLRS